MKMMEIFEICGDCSAALIGDEKANGFCSACSRPIVITASEAGWLSLEELKAGGVFPREVLVAAWNGEEYTVSQACAFEDGAFRWCWELDLDETIEDSCFDVHFWQPLPKPPLATP